VHRFELAAGMEGDPERGKRCTMCFDMRMDVTADYAASHDFQVIATTNATSRWKDAEQVWALKLGVLALLFPLVDLMSHSFQIFSAEKQIVSKLSLFVFLIWLICLAFFLFKHEGGCIWVSGSGEA